MRLRPFAPLGLLVLTGYLACTPAPVLEQPAPAAPRLTGAHRTAQNGLTSNGLFQNGLFQNGLFQNGLFQNGLFQNGLFQNSLALEALWQRETWEANPPALAMLRDNVYARDVLKYVYECAKTPDQSKVIALEGVTLELHGLVGLAPQPALPGSECDEICQQRWVTACLLARTNAYGLPVDISMRAPDNAPATVKAALSVTDDERDAYPLREGAFYGNLFRQAPRPGDGAMMMAPSFYGCAGPGSNIPQVTKRFCSSQGAGGPIQVPGTCEPRPEFPSSACLGVSGDPTTGAMHDCYEGINPAFRGEHYREVITVYLKKPIEVCGNAVCEEREANGTPAEVCPSDCHPGGWTRAFPGFIAGASALSPQIGANDVHSWVRTSALGPDDEIVLAGVASSVIDGGGGPLDPGDGAWPGVLAKYSSDNEYLWGIRFGFDDAGVITPSAVAVAPDGSIGVLLQEHGDTDGNMRLAKFGADGHLEWSKPFLNDDAWNDSFSKPDGLAFDGQGNFFVAGHYRNPVTFDGTTFGSPLGFMHETVVKISPAGHFVWEASYHIADISTANMLAADAAGNVLLSVDRYSNRGFLWKIDGATGEPLWEAPGIHGGVATGPNGNVYATGSLDFGPYRFDIPPTASWGDFFLVEYAAADGTPLHTRIVGTTCPAGSTSCAGLEVPHEPYDPWTQSHYSDGYKLQGRDVTFDAAGNVVVGVLGKSADSAVDFGTGPFRTYASDDVFVAAFSPQLEPLWSKHVPMVLDGNVRGLHINGHGRVVMSGDFAGSMLVDDRMLVSPLPEQASFSNTFLASFAVPDASDVAPPDIDREGILRPMTLEATSAEGAKVFFMPPTSLDAGHTGSAVTCSPPPNAVFPIGTTVVTCTASDPLGNQTSASVPITVADHTGPAFSPLPAPVVVESSGPNGAVVTYGPPLALDLVDGARPVSCHPPSGSVFPVGTAQVACSAEDANHHRTQGSFDVTVTNAASPVFTYVPTPVLVEATGLGGATVTFELPTAVDVVDGGRPVTCAPASGALFPVGTTTVVCLTSDAQGNHAQASFDVTVVDFAPPALTLPTLVEATATSTGGAVVTYSASADDVANGALPPTCSPPSGALFPLGTTTVTCSATDPSGNTATSSFPVSVTYAWSGLLKPLDSDGQAFPVGTKLKLRFRLVDDAAGITNANATLTAAKLLARPAGAEPRTPSPDAVNGAMPFRYNPSKGWYEYELATKSMAPGEWNLHLQLGDGVARSVQIRLWR